MLKAGITKHFFLLLIFTIGYSTFAQNTQIDSLKKLLSILPDNSKKVDVLNKLSWKVLFNSPDEAFDNFSKAVELSKKINYKYGLAQSYNGLGAFSSVKSNQKEALKYYIESLKIKEELKDERGIGISYINIGQIYSSQGQYKESLSYFKRALTIFIKIHNESEIAATYNSLGGLYEENNLHDSAIYYFQNSLSLRKKLNDEPGLSECYGNLATAYHSKGDNKKAIVYYKLDNIYNEKVGNDYSTSLSLNNLSLLYSETGNLDEAISLSKKSIDICSKKGYLENLRHALGNIAQFYRTQKKYAEAHHYLLEWVEIKDSLSNIELSRTINDLSVKYETDKKEKDNKLLQTQNELSAKTIKQQKTTTYFILTGLILVIGLAFFIFRGLTQQRKANKIITEQKLEVEIQKHIVDEKQKEILDSITYARRIQQSLLPTEKYIARNIKNKSLS